jgi:hypothetical protein
MATRFAASHAKLADCQQHGAGSGADPLLVEGDSAAELLRSLCVDPSTRVTHAVSAREMQAVIEVFGGAA